MLKKIILSAVILLTTCLSANEFGLVNNHANLNNDLVFAQSNTEGGDDSESTGTISVRKKKAAKMKEYRDGKSPLLASGLSLLIPGVGEAYGEDYLMGGIFLGVEASLWAGYLVYEKDGDDQTKKYKTYADANFDYTKYYQAVFQMISNVPQGNIDTIGFRPNYDQLLNMSSGSTDAVWLQTTKYLNKFLKGSWNPSEGTEFTHQLPTRFNPNSQKHELDRTQQYYEMIGKYHQFASGWNDFTGWQKNTHGADSLDTQGNPILITGVNYRDYESDKRLNIYESMRDEANQAYEVGQNFVMLALLNRVVSAFDASYIIKRDFTLNTALRFENNDHQPGPLSANNYKMSLNISW